MSNSFNFWEWVDELSLAILILFIAVTLIQIVYYLVFYVPILWEKKKQAKADFDQAVSVIIAAHNEAENLKKFLPKVLEQEYPKFEVIVINDRSKDDTETVLTILKKKYPHLRTSFIKDNGKLKHGKKLAITLGIKASQYDYIVLTDADCEPSSSHWISEMASGLSNSDVVLGYGPYFEGKGFLNKLIRYETSSIALQYMGFAKRSVPYMGIGRNLAYKKDLFVEHRGFVNHAHLRSGDDDLFVNEVSSKASFSYNLSPDSFAYSVPETKWKHWVRQKQRHFSTFSYYKKKHLFLLSLETYSRVLFYLLLPITIALFSHYYWVFAIAFLRFLMLVSVQSIWAKKVKEPKVAQYAILFDLLLPILYFFLYLDNYKILRKR